MTELAGRVQARAGASLSLDDIRGRSFMHRARTYFDHVLGIPLCPDRALWSTISEVAQVRHVFAHANGRVVGLSAKGLRLFEALQRRGDARDSYGSILLEPQYVRRALDAVDASLRDLIERTRRR